MSIWTGGSKRKPSGGRYHRSIPKKKALLGRIPSLTRASNKRVIKKIRTKGGGRKNSAVQLKEVNVYDPKKKKTVKAVIQDVLENKASRHYVRMNVITKGAILKTNLGPVKVTNRPGQDGIANAVFTEYKEEVKTTKIKKAKMRKKKAHRDRKVKKVKVKREPLTKKVIKTVTKVVAGKKK